MTLNTFAIGAVPLATFMPARKTSLGDSVVEANGATITLAEGQTQVSFALISSAAISADMTGALSVAYQGTSGSASSNSWGLTVRDAGSTQGTLQGDFTVAMTTATKDLTRTDSYGQSVTVVVIDLRFASELIAGCAYSTRARGKKHHASCAANDTQWEVAA